MIETILVFVGVFIAVIVVGEWTRVFRQAYRMVQAGRRLDEAMAVKAEQNRIGLFNAAQYRNENYWEGL